MAADHLRKKSIGSNATGLSSLDHFQPKKRKLDSINSDLNSRSRITLEWDGFLNKVISRKDQISLSKRSMRPFTNSASQLLNILADVISVPAELFGLKNLNEVLSYEVWQNKLSEKERKTLMKYLPRNMDHNGIVETLLSGENFHFGNSFMQWGSKLCSGNLHPDTVYNVEENLMEHKREHYVGLQNYHRSMINNLQKLKDAWEGTKATDMEVISSSRRFKKGSDGIKLNIRSGSIHHDCVDDTGGTYKSSPSIEDDKTCSSDNRDSHILNGAVLQQRVQAKLIKSGSENDLVVSDDAEHEYLSNPDRFLSDGSMYMSYIKISKKQYHIIKNMNHSGKTIHSKSLRSVLGTANSLRIQPYEEFEKEESRKFLEHWLRLVKTDLPSAYARRKEEGRQRNAKMLLVCLEIGNNASSSDENEQSKNREITFQDMSERTSICEVNEDEDDQVKFLKPDLVYQNKQSVRKQESLCDNAEDDGSSKQGSTMKVSEDATSVSTFCNHTSLSDGHCSNDNDVEPEDIIIPGSKNIIRQSTDYNVNESSVDGSLHPLIQSSSADLFVNSSSTMCQNLPISAENGFSNVADGLECFRFSSGGNIFLMDASNSDVTVSRRVPLFVGDANRADSSVKHCVPIPSSRGFTVGQGVPISSGVKMSVADSFPYHNSGGRGFSSVADNPEQPSFSNIEEGRKRIMQRQGEDTSFTSFSNPDRSGLLQSLFSLQDVSYHAEHKDFRLLNNILVQDSAYNGSLHHLISMDQEKRLRIDNYATPNSFSEFSPASGGYSINMPAWNDSHFAQDGSLAQKWACDGVAADQSLYSVLSQCNHMRSYSPPDCADTTELMMLSRNYAPFSSGVASIPNAVPLNHHPEFLGSRGTAPDDSGWMNSQNASHDPMGRPFLRSWNQ